MVRVTEDLIRKRAEHNNLEISTLEEVSLHQQDIEKIENIDKWCRELKILYLQSNLIPKIENVGRLKKLEYLNLALNNVERIENLSGCESLQKLDLTINFVGELTSVENLQENIYLEELYLTGNPCADYENYREFVIAVLPRLKRLDGIEIEKSERIKALQDLENIRPKILEQQEDYNYKREKEKLEADAELKSKESKKKGKNGRWYTDINERDDGKFKQDANEEEDKNDAGHEDDNQFWQETVGYTPESRVAIHEHLRETRKKQDEKRPLGPNQEQRTVRLRTDDGKILNVNEAKLNFNLMDEEDEIKLEVGCYKHLDTSLLDVDVQPGHVTVYVKGKVLQLVLPEEVRPDSSTAQRSQTTGHLLISMPKMREMLKSQKVPKSPAWHKTKHEVENDCNAKRSPDHQRSSNTLLEVDPSQQVDLMIAKKGTQKPEASVTIQKVVSDGFIDDPDVPPLE